MHSYLNEYLITPYGDMSRESGKTVLVYDDKHTNLVHIFLSLA